MVRGRPRWSAATRVVPWALVTCLAACDGVSFGSCSRQPSHPVSQPALEAILFFDDSVGTDTTPREVDVRFWGTGPNGTHFDQTEKQTLTPGDPHASETTRVFPPLASGKWSVSAQAIGISGVKTCPANVPVPGIVILDIAQGTCQ
jgi:hypothetical protein